MSYIGNQIIPVPFVVDLFSGTGSATSFGPMVRAPAGTASIAVFISGVYKVPGVDYTVSGDTITFTAAPAVGTNNIVVHHLGNGFMATQVPGDGTVSGNKIQNNAIRANNIVAGQITGNLIGVYSVSGNQIGTGAISANNFAGGGITSNVLASNLSISLTRVLESANINDIAVGGNVNIDIANNTAYFFNANTTANVTFNLRANTQNTFDSITTTGQSATIAIAVKNGSNRYTANLMIDGVLQAPFFVANTRPRFQSISNQEINVFGYTVFKTAANAYTVLASNTLFGLS